MGTRNSEEKISRHIGARFAPWVAGYETRLRVFAPVAAAMAVMVVGGIIGARVYGSNPPSKFADIFAVPACLIAGITGLVEIASKEAYGFGWPITGRPAIALGLVWVLVFWGAAFFFA